MRREGRKPHAEIELGIIPTPPEAAHQCEAVGNTAPPRGNVEAGIREPASQIADIEGDARGIAALGGYNPSVSQSAPPLDSLCKSSKP